MLCSRAMHSVGNTTVMHSPSSLSVFSLKLLKMAIPGTKSSRHPFLGTGYELFTIISKEVIIFFYLFFYSTGHGVSYCLYNHGPCIKMISLFGTRMS